MAISSRIISLIRFGVLGTLLFFSLIVLGLAAHLASLFGNLSLGIPDTLGMGIAIPVLTLIVVVPVIVIDFIRKGAVTGMVAVELAWSSLLWVLWLANAGLIADRDRFGCPFFTFDGFGNVVRDSGPCSEEQAFLAFCWLSWLLISAWFTFLLIITVVAFSRGNSRVWNASVQDTDFFAYNKPAPTQQPAYNQGYGMQQQYTGQTMQPQYTGVPQQPQYTGGPQPVASYPPQGYNPTVGQV